MPQISDLKKELTNRAIREKVFTEACKILKQDGWNGFTMNKLAKAVGVAKGTLYIYFKDKLDVVIFINEQIFREAAEDFERALSVEGNCREILRNCLLAGRTKMDEMRSMRMILMEMHMRATTEEQRMRLRKDPEERIYKALIKFFQRGIDEGVFRKTTPEMLQLVLEATLDGLEVSSVFGHGITMADHNLLESVLDLLMDGMCVTAGSKK